MKSDNELADQILVELTPSIIETLSGHLGGGQPQNIEPNVYKSSGNLHSRARPSSPTASGIISGDELAANIPSDLTPLIRSKVSSTLRSSGVSSGGVETGLHKNTPGSSANTLRSDNELADQILAQLMPSIVAAVGDYLGHSQSQYIESKVYNARGNLHHNIRPSQLPSASSISSEDELADQILLQLASYIHNDLATGSSDSNLNQQVAHGVQRHSSNKLETDANHLVAQLLPTIKSVGASSFERKMDSSLRG